MHTYFKISLILVSLFVSVVYYGCTEKEKEKPVIYNPPTVSATNPAIEIGGNSAKSGGTIATDGGTKILSRGLCWNLTGSPTIADKISTNASGLGSFESELKFLYPNTTYFVRAYAANAAGVNYGPEISFKTGTIPGTCSTNQVVIVDDKSARMGGKVSDGGGVKFTNKGICFSLKPNPTTEFADSVVNFGPGEGSFSGLVSKLIYSKKYYYRAFGVYENGGVIYGQDESFALFDKDETFLVPRIITSEAINIGAKKVTLGGFIGNLSGDSIKFIGVCWSNSPGPTILSAGLNKASTQLREIGNFSLDIVTRITPGDTHYVRTYIDAKSGTYYGNEIYFVALKTIPEVGTNVVSQTRVGVDTARIGYNLLNSGGGTLTALGVCYSTNTNPDLSNDKVFAFGNINNVQGFSSTIKNLLPGTMYFVKAFGTNEIGTSYGAERSFTTKVTLPGLTTNDITEIAESTAKTGGTIINAGAPAYTEKGVCYDTTALPTIFQNTIMYSGPETVNFSVNLAGLLRGKTYYVRAYAKASTGVVYGDQKSFTTLP